jgi:crotonobetainyl-CoA:carnitine CoA-transferase CaiB-like acyl-CoA transferase
MFGNIYDVYQISTRQISNYVTEISVGHIDWLDLQLETEANHLLITPSGVFSITDGGLLSVVNEDELWVCIPKLINLDDEGGDPYYSDNRAAKEVIENLKSFIIEVCPGWSTPKPGRRKSHRR